MEEIEYLNDRFSIEGELFFTEMEGDLVFAEITNKYAEATICLYGAHLTHFRPQNTFDVLWMSTESNFKIGKPIRGGIPICFPWFGSNAINTNLPIHGFARLMYWEVIRAESKLSGETGLTLRLNSSEDTKKYWPFDFTAEIDISVGATLKVELRITNTGDKDFEYTSAIHSYLNVSEIGNVAIEGLQGVSYYKGNENELFTQDTEYLSILQEENRRYINTQGDVVLHDSAFQRKIVTSKQGSRVTVIWNPWSETVKTIADIPNDGYQTYVCIEPANAYDDFIQLKPGEKHSTIGYLGLKVD